MTRKDALKRLHGLAPQVEEHLEKIRNHPSGRDVPHWVKEIESWIWQMEAALPYVGKKTAGDWSRRIKGWKGLLGS
jgi:hypothetical protein